MMTIRELDDMIRRLKNLSARADLTNDGWHWLQGLIRERDERRRAAINSRRAKETR